MPTPWAPSPMTSSPSPRPCWPTWATPTDGRGPRPGAAGHAGRPPGRRRRPRRPGVHARTAAGGGGRPASATSTSRRTARPPGRHRRRPHPHVLLVPHRRDRGPAGRASTPSTPPPATWWSAAADSTEWIPLLDEGILPRNYAVVLTRCELARAALGPRRRRRRRRRPGRPGRRPPRREPRGLARRLARPGGARSTCTPSTPTCSPSRSPTASGAVWDRGLALGRPPGRGGGHPGRRRPAVGPVDRGAGRLPQRRAGGPAAAPWRTRAGRPVDAERWWGVARASAAGAAGWFDGGLVVAHKRRAPFRYRGPVPPPADDPRLRWASWSSPRSTCGGPAAEPGRPAGAARRPRRRPRPRRPPGVDARDEWIGFGDRIGVWAHRDPRLPLRPARRGRPGPDYAPTPRHPGAFEVPTDQPLACFVPLAWRGETRFAPGGRAGAVDHAPGALDLAHDAFRSTTGAPAGRGRPDPPGRRRRARYVVDGRTLTVRRAAGLPRQAARARSPCWSPRCPGSRCTSRPTGPPSSGSPPSTSTAWPSGARSTASSPPSTRSS